MSLPKSIQLPEAGLPLAYTYQADWGNLHVSEMAASDFGLVPLKPIEEGGAFTGPAWPGSEQNDVFVVSPSELSPFSQSSKKSGLQRPDRHTRFFRYRGGTALALAPAVTEYGLVEEAEGRYDDQLIALRGPADPNLDIQARKDELEAMFNLAQEQAPIIVRDRLAHQIGAVTAREIANREIQQARRILIREPIKSLADLAFWGTVIEFGNIEQRQPISPWYYGAEAAGFILIALAQYPKLSKKIDKALRNIQNTAQETTETQRQITESVHELFSADDFEGRFGF